MTDLIHTRCRYQNHTLLVSSLVGEDPKAESFMLFIMLSRGSVRELAGETP